MKMRILLPAALGLLLALVVWLFSNGPGPDDPPVSPDGAGVAASQPVKVSESQARMLVWELPETRQWTISLRGKAGGASPAIVTRIRPEEPESEGCWVMDAMESQSSRAGKWTTFAVSAATGEIRVIDGVGDRLPLSQWRQGLEPATQPADIGKKVLEFDLIDARKEITADLDDKLLLRAVAMGGDAGGGWTVEVIEKPADENPANLLYESPAWHGPHPSQIAAWHVADSYFPSTRDLAVRTYGHAVTIRVVDPAVKETDEQVSFTGGKAEVYFKPVAKFAGEDWLEIYDCLKHPKLLASGVWIDAKPTEPEPGTWAATIKHGTAVMSMTLSRAVDFYGDAISAGAVAIHHQFISNDDALIVLDLSAKPFARFDLAHPDKGTYGHTHYRVLALKDGKLRLEESQWASGKNDKPRMRTVTVPLKKPSALTSTEWQEMEGNDEGP